MENLFDVLEIGRTFGKGKVVAKGLMTIPEAVTKVEVKALTGIDNRTGKPYSNVMLYLHINNGQFKSFPVEENSGLELGEITDKSAKFTLICREDPNDPTHISRKVKAYESADDAEFFGVESLMQQIRAGVKHF